jgi:copper chaperone CopZ
MCKERIEKRLNKLEGVISSDVDYEKKVTTVEYDTELISLDDIREEISDIGYDADKVKKDERAYKRLHNCCKLPEDQKK